MMGAEVVIRETVGKTGTDTSRFRFGANWQRFLATLNDDRVAAAVRSLQRVFGENGLEGKLFLDIGSGSGLFSLAARRLGARVVSFDYDADSVACTQELRRREQAEESNWNVEQGSVLDRNYLESLGEFDVVYSWGVLHHTGQMWSAIDLASQRVKNDGRFWIAIYNDQGRLSEVWTRLKQLYVRLPAWLRPVYVLWIGGLYFTGRVVGRIWSTVLLSLLKLITRNEQCSAARVQPQRSPVASGSRGMHLWYDLVDWVGGYPFEVARPEEICHFLCERGFQLTDMTTVGGGLGCNEFIFRRERLLESETKEGLI